MINMNKLKKMFRISIFLIAIFTAMQAVAVAQTIEFDYKFSSRRSRLDGGLCRLSSTHRP